VLHGSETQVSDGLRALLAMGAGEIIAAPAGACPDPAAAVQRALRLVADLAKTPA
jgi:hypothetical protein